jgi:glycosyltransferase involved in cell wall biosynthesis
MGTYPPRECGIATFNQDLLKSSQHFLGKGISCKVAAFNFSPLDTYVYPEEVAWEIDQNNKSQHKALANLCNDSAGVNGVIIQHEYGIYGGLDGEHILSFMEHCHKPMIVTLHTVLPYPSEHLRLVTAKIIELSNILVVLTENSKAILEKTYPQSIDKVHVIPHGVHETHFETTIRAKKKLKFETKIILSTFGLLSRGKGIEYVLRALPNVIQKHPNLLYLILGETHPVIRRKEGESYRKELARLVAKLQLKNHVKFYDQYLTVADLVEFLKATDIYVSTSINPDQAVSGTLSYALGTGRAVVSTAFAQAKEIITPESGRLVPIQNSNAFSLALIELLRNQSKLKRMHRKAYQITRSMVWENVASEYTKLMTQTIMPPINLKHLETMTDDFGLFQFAMFDKPNKAFGYTLDDNARALIAMCWLKPFKTPHIESLRHRYLQFIKACQLTDGSFINYLSYQDKGATKQNNQEDLDDALARALWALSIYVMNQKQTTKDYRLANSMFAKALVHTTKLTHHRSIAFVIKALANMSVIEPSKNDHYHTTIKRYADILLEAYVKNTSKSWHWFDSYLGYNNAVIPESLLVAGSVLQAPAYTKIGKQSLAFLIEKTFSANRYLPIGHSHWYIKDEKRSNFDQQPEEPASMIMALVTAHAITHDEYYAKLARVSFSWFLGNNSLQTPLYNYENGGCYDGLHPDRVNLNQGAESLVSYILSRAALATIQ